MTQIYRLSVDPSHSTEEIWNLLESIEADILYSSEEGNEVEIFARIPSLESLTNFSWILKCEPYDLPPIDWEAQWAHHAHDFQDGHIRLDFEKWGRNSPPLVLKPGGGFGDLSHPTTRLMLKMMARHLNREVVIDVGCGSGILALSAVAMGAPLAYGIDIEGEAIVHSRENALLNDLGEKCFFDLPSDFVWEEQMQMQSVLVLMNMIMQEQIEAWSSLPILHFQPCEVMTSGIRIEEREGYLKQIKQWGWDLKEEQEESGWLAFCFVQNLRVHK